MTTRTITFLMTALVACSSSGSDPDRPVGASDPEPPAPAPMSAPLPGDTIGTPEGTAGHDDTHENDVEHYAPAASRTEPFFSLLNHVILNQVALTEAEITASSTLIVRGTVVSVVDGRVLDYAEGASNPIHTAVAKVDVEQVMKGDVGDYAYVEFIRGGTPAGDLDGARSDKPMVMFLHEADGWDMGVYDVQGEGKGVEAGATLYTLRTQQGLLVARAGRVEQPLSDEPGAQMFDQDEVSSLQDVENRVRALRC